MSDEKIDGDLRASVSETILSVAAQRGAEKSTCPSANKVVITQKGVPVDVDHIKGPVRIKIV